MRVLPDDDFGDLDVVVVTRFGGVGLQKGLEGEIGGLDWWYRLLGTGEAIGGLAVGEDEGDVSVWKRRGVLCIDEGLQVGAFITLGDGVV